MATAQTGPIALDLGPDPVYISLMFKNESNSMTPYADYILQKGYTLRECYRPSEDAIKREVPARFKDCFATYEEYEEAMADFLNGM